MRKTVRFAVAVAFACSLVSCGEDGRLDIYTRPSPTTSGEHGPFIQTSRLAIIVETYYLDDLHPTSGRMSILLRREDTFEVVRIGSSDNLTVTLDGVTLPINERGTYYCDGPLGPCQYYYDYYVDISNADGKIVVLDFERTSDNSAVSAGTFPPRPLLSSPAEGSTLNLSTEALNVSWQAGDPSDYVNLEVRGECVYDAKIFLSPTNSYDYSAGDPDLQWLSGSTYCQTATSDTIAIKAIRFRQYNLDSNLGPDSLMTLSTEDIVNITANK